MGESNKAVFLSYASQDAEAARRICDALRREGIEVWLDQSELRGGDAWDQRIRQQIRDCTLFIPIISINTASRPEGYFRLEWDLADQRTIPSICLRGATLRARCASRAGSRKRRPKSGRCSTPIPHSQGRIMISGGS